MRGEHRGEARAFDQSPIFGPAHRAVVRIGTQEMLSQAGQDRIVLGGVDAPDIGRQPTRPVGEGGVAEMADQTADRRFRQFQGVDPPGDGQGNQQHRVAERILSRFGTEAGGKAEQLPGQRGGTIGLGVDHCLIVRRMLRRSKRHGDGTKSRGGMGTFIRARPAPGKPRRSGQDRALPANWILS